MGGGGDNSEPLHHGFSTGFHLAFHGENNRALKSKLHRVYLQYCPPLAHGIFMSEEQIMVRSALTLSTQQSFFEDYDLHGQGARQLPMDDSGDEERSDFGGASWDDDDDDDDDDDGDGEEGEDDEDDDGWWERLHRKKKDKDSSSRRGGRGGRGGEEEQAALARKGASNKKAKRPEGVPIRVGWLSRFMHRHAIGYISQGIVARLPRPKFRVLVFKIENAVENGGSGGGRGQQEDEGGHDSDDDARRPLPSDLVAQHIEEVADDVFVLPPSLNAAAEIIRQQRLDVLVSD